MPVFVRKLRYRFRARPGHRHRYLRSVRIQSGKSVPVWLAIFLLLGICIFGLTRIERRIGPLAQQAAVSALNGRIVKEANLAAEAVLEEEGIEPGRLILIERDENGSVRSLTTDYAAVNRIKAALAVQMQERIAQMGVVKTYVPAGMLVSDTLYTGAGFHIPIRIFAAGTVDIRFYDEFTSAGINQTRYKLMVEITAPAQVAGILSRQETQAVTQVPLADAVVVGTVPQNYLNMNQP